MPLNGQIGIAPEWETGACGKDCQEKVSACVLAHVNTSGKHIALWLDGPDAAIGWGKNASYPFQEGSFFGNIFLKTPVASYCNGVDFEYGVVPGRLGANQTGAPYTDPIGTNALCGSGCTAASGAYPYNDGFSVCYGAGGVAYKHVVTVWRDFDPTTAYKICDRQTRYCLKAQNSTAGSQIVKAAYTAGSTAQQWMITQTAAGSGKYKVVNFATGMALATANGSSAVNAAIVQSAYTGAATQMFLFSSVADGTGFFQIQPSTTTLDAIGTGTGSNIVLESWGWVDDQKMAVQVAN